MRLAEEMGVQVLGQIPIVQSICDGGDKGKPVALQADSITGQAFAQLAQHVEIAVEKRNQENVPTQKVEVHNK